MRKQKYSEKYFENLFFVPISQREFYGTLLLIELVWRYSGNMDKISFFSADYRDGRVHIGGKSYPAGIFAAHLLTQYYIDDTAARIIVFTSDTWLIEGTLEKGYLYVPSFLRAGADILNIFNALPWLKPFDMLDVDAERNRIAGLFTEENGNKIVEYFQRRSKVMAMDVGQAMYNILPKEFDEDFFKEAAALLNDVKKTLAFYDGLRDDLMKTFKQLKTFASRVDEADRFDEEHLLPIALEIFGSVPFPVTTEYVPILKSTRSKTETLARRLYFDSYYNFVITDFFEGLHHGHYPRQCGICKKYFLMTSAARQKYCTGYAPFKVKGKAITCRKYAARINRKEYADANPIIRLYKNRCSALRMERKRGKHDDILTNAALAVAKERMQRAKADPDYANGQYEADMLREELYAEVDRRLNGK